ncbi:hypothetical protein IQ254_17060 [Nodosilinea sp. LEGE 07088]|uniref:hypothetical protein n=1 Tax=Nodosilinea sp. LEGE 07088 TaxID=2777968 RepID=UPI0018804BE3|nr:hypothetical protein [Nodosilinea sp. LEGE 07088]MBE9138882.1 hypothetical protein [Nodosilinea sp. LEGE 07088]
MVSPVISRPALDVSPSPSPRPTPALGRQGWRQRLPRPKHPHLWGLGVGSVVLGVINGALVISAGVGLVAYQQLLQLSPRQRKGLVDRLRQGLPLPTSPQHQAWVLAGVAGTSTYTFTALWHSTHSLLMALLLTGQGALALYALGALVRGGRASDRPEDRWDAAPIAQVEHNLTLLGHADPLKRLVAVRRLVRLAEQSAGDTDYGAGVSVRSHLIDCFRVMLGQELDPIVRSALVEGLDLLRPSRTLAASQVLVVDLNTPPDTVPDVAFSHAHQVPQPSESLELATQTSPDPTLPVQGLAAVEEPQLEAIRPEASRPEGPSLEPLIETAAAADLAAPRAAIARGRRSAVEYVEYVDI